MMERIYLSDWLYNAGIIGFLRIMLEDQDLDGQNIIGIGENYIEFDRNILDGFSQKYFDFAFRRYGRYERVLNRFLQFLEDLKLLKDKERAKELSLEYKKDITEVPIVILEKVQEILKNFAGLKNKLEYIPTKADIKDDPERIEDFLEEIIDLMKRNYKEFWESDVQIYLRGFYGQKSFLNNMVTQNRFERFYRDFEEKILNNEVKYEKDYKCIICGERKAKKGTMFDTGISPFYGLNPDSLNFSWNFKPILPICEMCELIYLCYFAGLSSFSRNNGEVYYFVNRDTSIKELYRANNLLEQILQLGREESFLVEFFTQLILETEKIKAEYTLKNIAVIELDLHSEVLPPKVYSFNISDEKARYIKDNHQELKKLSRKYYKIKDEIRYVLIELLDKILENSLNYGYLDKLLRLYLYSEKSEYKIGFNIYDLQELNGLIYKFERRIFSRRETMEDKELWYIYHKGKELSQMLKNANAENKITSIAYKLLNALKVGDVNQFMDTIMRIYLSYEIEIPSTFVKMMGDKEIFFPVGYSFLNGLLEREKEGNIND